MQVVSPKTAYLLLISFEILYCSSSFAGWSDDIQLTHRGYENHCQVIARNDTIHVAWQEHSGPQHISYMRSIDGGFQWSDQINLEAINHYGLRQDLSLSGSQVFVGWQDVDTVGVDNTNNIAFAISQGGDNWSAPGYVFPIHNRFPNTYALSTNFYADSIYVVYIWPSLDSTGNHQFLFRYSSDLGDTWSDSTIVGRTWQYLNGLRIRRCGENIYIVWSAVGINAFDVFAAISHDGGNTWEEPRQLSSDIMDAQQPCIACDESNGHAAIGWVDSQESHSFPGDLYLKITSDGGISWGEELHATHHHKVASTSIAFAGDSLWAVWSDWDIARWGPLNYEICFTNSSDLGQNWIPYQRLTNASGFGFDPWIDYDNSKLHVVWEDRDRPPDSTGSDIYYKRFEPDVGIGNEQDDNIPNRVVFSAYPNPFNSSIMFSYLNLKGGEIDIFDIQGKLIKRWSVQGGGNGKINWDATDASGKKVSSGIYFAKAASQNNSSVIKLIYLK